MKKILVMLTTAALLISCYPSQRLHQSGSYTIKERNGNLTEFYEVKGKYSIICDTLKKNDRITINVIKARPLRKSSKAKADIARF